MSTTSYPHCTAFEGFRRLASGPLDAVALSVKRALERTPSDPVLIYDDGTGQVIDIDIRGSDVEVIARLPGASPATAAATNATDEAESTDAEPRGRGRPKLGVTAREITLLPRQWEWLAAQPGGASVTLRKLVDAARKGSAVTDQARKRTEAAYHFMSAIAGDLSGFEEASRSLFAHDRPQFESCIGRWPADVRDHVLHLAFVDAAIEMNAAAA